ncbi:MAG TPA: hypothetical protein VKB67_08230 [Rhizomicrobium sp.]|nr:hypothetical protein [Rhizomicrobium sp.]
MESFSHAPVTLAAIAAMTAFLSGCIAMDAAGDMADAGVSVVTTTGDATTSYFGGDDSGSAQQPD